MNDDLRNALEQLKRRACGQGRIMWPEHAQALLDERAALREALEYLVATLDCLGYGWPGGVIGNTMAKARATLAETRNEEV